MAELVYERYGSALFEVAKEADCMDDVMEELNVIKAVIKENPDLVKLLTAKTINKASQKEILTAVFCDTLSTYSENLLKVMVDNGRIEVLVKTIEKFKCEYLAYKGKIEVTVITAVELSDNQIDKLAKKLQSLINKETIITNIIDKSIIGGIILKINNEQIDNSVKGKIEDLRKQLLAVTM